MTMEAAQTGGIAMRMPVPNAWRVALFALLVGGTLGGGSRALTAALRPWRLGEFDPAKPGNSVPRVEAPSTQYSFGTMAEGAEETHEFIIGNSGEDFVVLSYDIVYNVPFVLADMEGTS